MDAMALLCNLHADGPATLRSLREGGCGSIEELLALAPEHLAELLGIAPAAARRFLREGRSLAERLGGELLEREEERAPAVAVPRAAAVDPARLPLRERELLSRVLQRPPAANGAATRPTPAPVGTPLAVGALEGLDAALCLQLGAAGVATLEALADCALEAVDRATGLGWSRLRRLQFLARRQLQRPPAPRREAAVPRPTPLEARREPLEEKISLAFPLRPGPALEPQPAAALAPQGAAAADESPGGPFA